MLKSEKQSIFQEKRCFNKLLAVRTSSANYFNFSGIKIIPEFFSQTALRFHTLTRKSNESSVSTLCRVQNDFVNKILLRIFNIESSQILRNSRCSRTPNAKFSQVAQTIRRLCLFHTKRKPVNLRKDRIFLHRYHTRRT